MRRAVSGVRLGWVTTALIVVLADVVTPFLALTSGLMLGAIAGLIISATLVALPGGLLAARQPRNPAGWLLLIGSGGWTVTAVLNAYGNYGVQAHPGALPLALPLWAVGTGGWWMLMFFAVPLLLMLFPDGQLPSRRWRPLAVCLAGFAVLSVAAWAFAQDHLDGDPDLPVNPLGTLVPHAVPFAVLAAAGAVLIVATAAALVSLVRRLRVATGIQRAQYQWFTYGTAVCAFCLAIAFLPGVPQSVVGVGVFVFLVSLAVAMLRYRLFEIGRVVSRTISYALLTGVLVAAYAVLVTFVTTLLPRAGSLAIAVATLAVAAAFNPLRRRLQTAVDRRFNRRRYDAARTVDGFAHSLRSEVDLDVLVAELRTVVHQTLEPARLLVWLRQPAGR